MKNVGGGEYGGLDSDEALFDLDKKKEFITSSFIHKLQLKHFIFYNVLPPMLGLGLLVYLWSSNQLLSTRVEWITAIALWVVSGLGITVGYHRCFTHCSFKPNRVLKILLHLSGLIAGQGGAISWSATHRQHHKYSDVAGDPHSPNLDGEGFTGISKGIIHSHFTWMRKHKYPNVMHYVPDLIHDRDMILVDRYYGKIFLLGLIIPGLISYSIVPSIGAFLSGVLIGGVFRVVVLGNTIWAINSFLHRFGERAFNTRDKSRNLGLLAPFSFGEAWHNNHHAFPGSAAFGLRWYQLDFGYYTIKLFELLRLAAEVKKPSTQQIKIRQEKNRND